MDAEVLSLSFNQDFSCFAVGLSTGFRIYEADPFQELYRHEFPDGGVSIVEMLGRTNILAMVGGGPRPQFEPNSVVIWDNIAQHVVWQIRYKTLVRGVKLRHERMVVVLDNRILHYLVDAMFDTISFSHAIDTGANPRGLCAVSPSPGPPCVVCPSPSPSDLLLQTWEGGGGSGGRGGGSKMNQYFVKGAHKGPIYCLAMNEDGSLVATASDKGTLLRVFNPRQTQAIVAELRRGGDEAQMLSMSFSPDARWILCVSDKGTLHLFSLSADVPNQTSRLASLPISYASSQWSVAQFPIQELQKDPMTRVVAGFGPRRNSILILTQEGLYECEITENHTIRQVAYNKLNKEWDD